MPISITCRCGKQLRLKDEAVGRHIRCSACGDVLLVPGHADTADEEPSPDEFLRSLAQTGDVPTDVLTPSAADPAKTEPSERPHPLNLSSQSEHRSAAPEIPYPEMPFAGDDVAPPFFFAATLRFSRPDRTARVAVLIFRLLAWLGLAGAVVYVLITVVGTLLVAATADADVSAPATALSGIFGLASILATLATAVFWWALLIALASITENLVEIRRNGPSQQPRSPDD